MRRALMIAVAVAMMASAANAQKIDANGRCHAKNGQFAKMDVCKGAPGATATKPMSMTPTKAADAKGPYKKDAKGMCHDAKGHMAAKAKCA